MGGGAGETSTPATDLLMGKASGLLDAANPSIMALLAQGLKSLRTGGINMNVPMVHQAVESSRAAGADALRGSEADLARSGLAGTPFAAATMGPLREKSAQDTNTAGFNQANWFMQMLPQFVTGLTGSAFGGLGAAGNQQANLASTNTQADTSKGNSLMNFFGGGAGSAITKYCWIAREVYGIKNIDWLIYRQWLLTKAPRWFRFLYITFGESFAQWLQPHRRLKTIIRFWMNQRIRNYLLTSGE